jgi:hypothetical protein
MRRIGILLGVAVLGLPLLATFFAPPPASASTTPSLTLTPNAGPAGTTVTATVSGFDPEAGIHVTYGPAVPPLWAGACNSDATGSCAVTFVVPPGGPTGPFTVTATEAPTGVTATSTFTDTSALGVTLDPSTGNPDRGLLVDVGGFDPGETVDLDFATSSAGSCVAGSGGVCETEVIAPFGPAGPYLLTAVGEMSGLETSAIYTLIPILTVLPQHGTAGTSLTAAGYGFASDETVDVTFDSSPVGSCTTDSLGECSTAFGAPSEAAGSYSVAATGTTSRLVATTTFTETGPPSLTLTPGSGPSGTELTARAAGFVPGEQVWLSYGGFYGNGCAADSTGSCSMTFKVPAAPGGPYTVSVTGATSGLEESSVFTEIPAISLGYGDSGPAQNEMAVSVSAYAAGETVVFSYGPVQEGTCTADSTGACGIGFAVPTEPAGFYTVSAVGQTSGDTTSVTFSETPTLTLSASIGPVGSNVSAQGGGFVPGESVDITYGSSSVASCTANGAGACTTSFDVPDQPSGWYAVTATGSISGIPVSTNFRQYGVLSLGAPSGPQGSTVSASVAGLSADETVGFQFENPNQDVASCTTDAHGNCSAKIVVPAYSNGTYGISASDTGDDSVNASFEIVQMLTLSPDAGVVGTTVSAAATGFGGPGDTADPIEFSLNGTNVASCSVDITGDCSANFALPPETAGSYTVTALGLNSGLSASAPLTELPPSVTSVSPNQGKLAAGTAVTIVGSGFTGSSVVYFGTKKSTSVTVVNATTITAKSPAGIGPVNITVATPQGTSAITPTDVFTYLGLPTVIGVSPEAGLQGGGTVVTLTGTNFYGPATVYFGSVKATVVTVVNSSTILVTSPVATGTQNVRVVTSSGESVTSTADRFQFFPPPTVTRVAPATGSMNGGTTVTISGTGFVAPAEVFFGGVPATKIVVYSGNRIGAVSPAGTPGTANVTVMTPYGTSAASTLVHFTYKT